MDGRVWTAMALLLVLGIPECANDSGAARDPGLATSNATATTLPLGVRFRGDRSQPGGHRGPVRRQEPCPQRTLQRDDLLLLRRHGRRQADLGLLCRTLRIMAARRRPPGLRTSRDPRRRRTGRRVRSIPRVLLAPEGRPLGDESASTARRARDDPVPDRAGGRPAGVPA